MDLRKAARVVLPLYLGSIYATLGVMRVLTDALRSAGLLRFSVAVAFALVSGIIGGLIARDPQGRSWRVLGALAGCAAVYTAVIWPMESPEEKLHFIEYGLLALLADRAAPARWSARGRFIGAALFVISAGWVDELIQGLLPSRHYDLRDVGFNAVAGFLALGSLTLVRWARTRAGSVSTSATFLSRP
jgi:hypothetical protein